MFKPYLRHCVSVLYRNVKSKTQFVFVIFILNKPLRAFAFDPYTTMTAANAAAGFLNSTKNITDGFAELSQFSEILGIASETADESAALINDLGFESQSDELDHKVEKLEKLNSKIKDLKWTSSEMKYTLDSDINQTKSLSQKLKQMRKIISMSKKLAGVFGLKTKGSDKVATLQQVKINSLMLDELQAMRKMQLLGYLENKERIANQDLYLNKILNEETIKNSKTISKNWNK
jgi:hypothetical protein